MKVKIFNTCPNEGGAVWLGCYLNLETGECTQRPTDKSVLVTVDQSVRLKFESNGIPLLGTTVQCTLREEVYTKGRNQGKKYLRIIDAVLPRINNELAFIKRKYAQVSIKQTKTVIHYDIVIGDDTLKLEISNYDDLQVACSLMEDCAMQYDNNVDLLNMIIDFENKLLDKIYGRGWSKNQAGSTSRRKNHTHTHSMRTV